MNSIKISKNVLFISFTVVLASFVLLLYSFDYKTKTSIQQNKKPNSSFNILPTPASIEILNSEEFKFKKNITIVCVNATTETAQYLANKLKKYVQIKIVKSGKGDIVLHLDTDNTTLKEEGYILKVEEKQIAIEANSNSGLFYGIQSLLQLLPVEVQAQKSFNLQDVTLSGVKIIDQPKYSWRGFMLDSGRQYQRVEFIKHYLDYMAMLKMNVFHWHLTEGQGWRIEIKKYPKLAEIGSKVAKGKEQQGYYTQAQIKDVINYAKKLHITVVPEIDVPGHSEAALTAYPEMTCFGNVPESVMGFSSNIFCAGREETYQFLEDILDEVSALFPSKYIHLGGDEAPKANWNRHIDCQNKIKNEGLKDSHELQLYFSSRLANYLKSKNKKAIFWGDVVYHDGIKLPDNVIIQWWNWRGHKDKALKNAIKRGYPIISNTNYYTYLNFPVTPWSEYDEYRTFDMQDIYENNPSNLENPNKLVTGMSTSLWTDWYVQEHMIDRRVFPRIYALAEQMWSKGKPLSFDKFHEKVENKYLLLKLLGIDYGPALRKEVGGDYKWD